MSTCALSLTTKDLMITSSDLYSGEYLFRIVTYMQSVFIRNGPIGTYLFRKASKIEVIWVIQKSCRCVDRGARSVTNPIQAMGGRLCPSNFFQLQRIQNAFYTSVSCFKTLKIHRRTQWCKNRGGQGGHWPPQYLSDQLTLSGNALGIWICGCRCILEISGSQNSGCT